MARFANIFSHCSEPGDETSERREIRRNQILDRIHHFTTPTLPHLLALLAHPSNSFPPQGTSFLVIDSISILFALAFPKQAENSSDLQNPVKKNDATQWAAGRRWAVMGDLISKIGRLSATRNLAALLISQTTTRIRSETGAVLHQAISGTAWESGIITRIVLFRDWPFKESKEEYEAGVRFAGVRKAKGLSYEGVGMMVAFTITEVQGKRCLKDEGTNLTT